MATPRQKMARKSFMVRQRLASDSFLQIGSFLIASGEWRWVRIQVNKSTFSWIEWRRFLFVTLVKMFELAYSGLLLIVSGLQIWLITRGGRVIVLSPKTWPSSALQINILCNEGTRLRSPASIWWNNLDFVWRNPLSALWTLSYAIQSGFRLLRMDHKFYKVNTQF